MLPRELPRTRWPSRIAHSGTRPVIVSQWLDPAHTEKNVGWARDFWRALQPFAGGCAYVNDLGQDDENRMSVAYGPNYERLAALKKKYDPDNFFCHNPNIKPAG